MPVLADLETRDCISAKNYTPLMNLLMKAEQVSGNKIPCIMNELLDLTALL